MTPPPCTFHDARNFRGERAFCLAGRITGIWVVPRHPLFFPPLAAACADAGGSIDISLDNLIYGSRFRKKTYHMGSLHRVPTAVDLIFESITLFNLHIILTP